MTKFEAIENMWENTETMFESFRKRTGEESRLSFVKSLLNYHQGEIGLRKLIAAVQRDGEEAGQDRVERLCERINTAYENVRYYIEKGAEPKNLNGFCEIKYLNRFTIDDMLVTVPPTVPSVQNSLEYGSIFPLIFSVKGEMSAGTKTVKEYFKTFYSEQEIVYYYQQEKEREVHDIIFPVIIDLIRQGLATVPMVITDGKTIPVLKKSIKECKELISQQIDSEISYKAYQMVDCFNTVCVVALEV